MPWTLANSPLPDVYAVCWSPQLNLFVAVAANQFILNQVMTSSDGIVWTQRACPAGHAFTCVAWSPALHLFAAMGAQPFWNVVALSANGVGLWADQTPVPPYTTQANSIAWSPALGLFVTIGVTDSLTSSDGINWNHVATGQGANTLAGLAWSPTLGILVAGCLSNSLIAAFTTVDGINWISRAGAGLGTLGYAMAWSPDLGIFCGVGNNPGDGAKGILTSSDGINWIERVVPANGLAAQLTGIAWSPALQAFAAVSSQQGAPLGSRVLYSWDGINWMFDLTAPDRDWRSIVWSPALNLFVATNAAGAPTNVMYGTVPPKPSDFLPGYLGSKPKLRFR